jgi:O-antigen biosynthesis protein WbqP
MYEKYIKRLLDVFFASIFIVILLIPFVIISALIKLDSRGSVFFKQKRAGKNLKPFIVYKFRTMTTNAPKNCPTNNLTDANIYITRLGEIMRKLSIDELPQLINVVKGDMSLVGPRPVILFETDLLSEREKYNANSCEPGITGWAQVNGRDELAISVKAEMDGEYANQISFAMDAKCLLMTIGAVLSIKGNKDGHELVDTDLTKQQPRIVTNYQTAFYAKVPSYTGKTDKRLLVRRAAHVRNREELYEI